MLVQVYIAGKYDRLRQYSISNKGQKAWSNANLTRLAEKIRSSLVLYVY